MNKKLALSLLVAGFVLIGFGIMLSSPGNHDFSRPLTDFRGTESLWLMIVGAVAVVIGDVAWIRVKKIQPVIYPARDPAGRYNDCNT